MKIQWRVTNPETGDETWICAERFARVWSFKTKAHRRDDWSKMTKKADRAIWEHLLDALKRKYTRRDEAELIDIADVEKILKEMPADG